ncbi:MAG: primosomal protein N' (replication factor Y) [Gammaproteobacteria bacterium]
MESLKKSPDITSEQVVSVAVFAPLRQCYSYLAPHNAVLGARVIVPFGASERVGVVVAVDADGEREKLKPVRELLDQSALFPADCVKLLLWAERYYQHPVGEIFATALPSKLKNGGNTVIAPCKAWKLTEEGRQLAPKELTRSSKQSSLLESFQKAGEALASSQLVGQSAILKALETKGLVEQTSHPSLPALATAHLPLNKLNPEQQLAGDSICNAIASFTYKGFLLDGVTGSGKTEVYIHAAKAALDSGKQVLLLVPEIGLTPQLIGRFTDSLHCRYAALHSGLNDEERRKAWLQARNGDADLVIGTRSSLFVPLSNLGLIIVDEEHDNAFKQQDGFRYSARDLALVRAHMAKAVAVLGSATPSLESQFNQTSGGLELLRLRQRAASATPPKIRLLDIRGQHLDNGLSPALIGAIETTVARGQQALIFLNRRGYAPALLCHACGWGGECSHCDSHMTLHRGSRFGGKLQCHHCGASRPAPNQCPSCKSIDLIAAGQGTERLEERLNELFPQHNVLRVDRDTTRSRTRFAQALDDARSGKADILIGTQMLGKGHDFPKLGLVGVLDSDNGLHSVDFRSTEKLAQLVLQVAGRAGRSAEYSQESRVIIQTHQPDHSLMKAIVTGDYQKISADLIQQREDAQWPPFAHLALLRMECEDKDLVEKHIQNAAQLASVCCLPACQLLGPVPAPLERKQSRWRYQLLFSASDRASLQTSVRRWLGEIKQLKISNKVRWSLDVDPQDLY